MLVTSDNKPALISTDQKLQWCVNSGEWTKTTGEAAKRLTIKLPTGDTRRVVAINLGKIDDTADFIMVLHGSKMIVQSDAFEYVAADYDSYLLSRLLQTVARKGSNGSDVRIFPCFSGWVVAQPHG